MNIAIITTFPNNSWEVYSKKAMQSWAQFLPKEIPILIKLDDEFLGDELTKLMRPGDQVAAGWLDDHKAFVERNKDKESPTDYRKQPVRFCHKVFALKEAMEALPIQKAQGGNGAKYLIWIDADVILTRSVTLDEIKECLPKEGDAVSYLGRKDWAHSECGWLAFDLEKGGIDVINFMYNAYVKDLIFQLDEWHDSWVFDKIFTEKPELKRTNLTEGKPGMDIWPHSPMGKWSNHFKGPLAKADLAKGATQKPGLGGNIIIQTKNAIPDEEIQSNIRTNQLLIKNWIHPCHENDEELVIVSAGPMLVAEDVREEEKSGRKIVAVKHALDPLKQAGIKPWACILLDPREHVAGFVEKPDNQILWIVASQVNPEVVKRLLEAQCRVWGYHAAVGAKEDELICKQDHAIIMGGSATATRGMYMLGHLGFRNFRLYGYDLCYADKPKDVNEKDKYGQPKYIDISVGFTHPYYNVKRNFWTEPQLIAQFEEINEMSRSSRFKIKAFGTGIVPFFLKAKETGELRERERKAKLKKLSNYQDLFGWTKENKSSTKPRKKWLQNRLKAMKSSS